MKIAIKTLAIILVSIIVLSAFLGSCNDGGEMSDFVFKETSIAVGRNLIMRVTEDGHIAMRGRIEVPGRETLYFPEFAIINNITDVYALSETAIARNEQFVIKTDGSVWEMKPAEKPSDGNYFAFTKVDGIGNCIKICVGAGHVIALTNDGTVWTWGRNDCGQLGNGTRLDSTSPQMIKGLSSIVDITAGGFHCLALDVDGYAYSWGDNTYGQLGNGKSLIDRLLGNDDKAIPRKIRGLKGVRQIAAGDSVSIALLGNGTVRQWGIEEHGYFPPTSATRPKRVKGLDGIVAISASGNMALALTKEGHVWQWGYLNNFIINDGDPNPPEMVGGLPKSIIVATGYVTSISVAEDGTIWLWGVDRTAVGITQYIQPPIMIR